MRFRLAQFTAGCLLLCGCHKEITSIDRKEAASNVSEAEFAINLKDWARAEDLYSKSVKLCPDKGDYWMSLGIVRMHVGKRDGAKSAYKSALNAFKAQEGSVADNSDVVIREAYALVLLGRPDEARSLVDRAHARHPENRALSSFVEAHNLDRMISDPTIKEISP